MAYLPGEISCSNCDFLLNKPKNVKALLLLAAGAGGSSEVCFKTLHKLKKSANMEKDTQYTVGHAIDALGFGKFQILLSATVGMAFVADAMEMMILSVLAPALHCYWQITQVQQASLTTVVFLGKNNFYTCLINTLIIYTTYANSGIIMV